MKVGLFANTYGDIQRLRNILIEFERYDVSHAFSLGNLISSLSQQPDKGLNKDSLQCLDEFEGYAPSSGRRFTPVYFRGFTEGSFLEREAREGRARSNDYNRIVIHSEVNMVGIGNDRTYGLTTDRKSSFDPSKKEKVDKTVPIPEPRRVLTEQDAINVYRFLRDMNGDASICCVGNTHTQSAFEISGGRASPMNQSKIPIAREKSYLVSPSYKNKGHMIIDDDFITLFD